MRKGRLSVYINSPGFFLFLSSLFLLHCGPTELWVGGVWTEREHSKNFQKKKSKNFQKKKPTPPTRTCPLVCVSTTTMQTNMARWQRSLSPPHTLAASAAFTWDSVMLAAPTRARRRRAASAPPPQPHRVRGRTQSFHGDVGRGATPQRAKGGAGEGVVRAGGGGRGRGRARRHAAESRRRRLQRQPRRQLQGQRGGGGGVHAGRGEGGGPVRVGA